MKEMIASNGIEIGKSAPDFELTKLDGTNIKLSDLKGKKVILNFLGNVVWTLPARNAGYGSFL